MDINFANIKFNLHISEILEEIPDCVIFLVLGIIK